MVGDEALKLPIEIMQGNTGQLVGNEALAPRLQRGHKHSVLVLWPFQFNEK